MSTQQLQQQFQIRSRTGSGRPFAGWLVPGRLGRNILLVSGGMLAAILVFWINAELVSRPAIAQLPGTPLDLTLEQVTKPEPLEEKIRREKKPPEKPQPRETRLTHHQRVSVDLQPPRLELTGTDLPGAIRTGIGTGPGELAPASSDAIIPIIRVEPNYPARAVSRGIEGYVKLAFTVLADGSVADIDILEAQPRNVFEQQAQRAVAKWKFQPRPAGAAPKRVTQTLNFRLPENR